MLIEHLINSALASGALVIRERSPGCFSLQSNIGGAYLTLSTAAVKLQTEPEPRDVKAKSAVVLGFPGAKQ